MVASKLFRYEDIVPSTGAILSKAAISSHGASVALAATFRARDAAMWQDREVVSPL